MVGNSTENMLVRFWNWISLTDFRLQELKNDGYTLDLSELSPSEDEHILEIDVGYGREYWLAPTGLVQVERKPRRVRGGRLILTGERPLSEDSGLRERGLVPHHQPPVKFR